MRDGNNAFFFNQVHANWNSNKILALSDTKGNMVTGHTQCAKAVVDFFKNSICTPHSPRSDFPEIQCKKITSAQAAVLMAPISNDLILNTLKAMKKNKAPSLDGLTVEFYLAT